MTHPTVKKAILPAMLMAVATKYAAFDAVTADFTPAKAIREKDLSEIYRIATECGKDGKLYYTFVLTQKTDDASALSNDAQPKIQMVESDKNALKSRVRMIRDADAERFLPSDTRIEEVWKKVDRYALNPCS